MHVNTLIQPTSDLLRTISDNSKSDKNTYSTFTCSKKFEFVIVSDIVRTFNMHVNTLIRPTSDLPRTISDNSKSDKNT